MSRFNRWLDAHGVTGGLDLGRENPKLAGVCLFAVTEKRTLAEIDHLVRLIAAYVNAEEVLSDVRQQG